MLTKISVIILITLTPDDVKQRFGPLFAKEFLVMVERAGIAKIIEHRIGAFGAVLWGNRGIEAAGLYGEPL